ncbi:F0F1 ATP synthase subunit B [Candidatus Methylacidithermus pantelleriae]|uniref:ATP synthase subunit b n=1 Tax=Candidatus Methylacidithermus pantelleriae TaxID=2744239 RepID=A0A8J2BJK0_9BACT|nr:F0F1 ATP synthase subunit B [Candidatus Methylacidithermus pantelleriae]CAF0689649.1 ATP synthase, F0 sector, subunit b [Candidatus Methylacidithermus pantelleriae]
MEETLLQLGISWPKLLAQTLNFAIVLFVLQRYAYRPILRLLEERRERIAESLRKAEEIDRLLAEAEAKRKAIVMEANQRASQIIEEAQRAAEVQGQRYLDRALQESEQILAKARELAAREREQTLAEVRRQVVRLVVELTSRVSGKVLTQEDHRRLQEETLAELERN